MNTATYAGRKRKKPQKSVKTGTAEEGAKSNPSKRHRERLNGELERLASLLPFPQDVVSKLDKLTVLRLSVSYLRAKSHLNVSLKSASVQHPEGNGLKKHGVDLLEGELLLQVLNGFVLVVTAGGNIFYASSTIQDYLGFHQSDVIHQRVFEFVHSDDRAEFQRQLHWALKSPPSPDAASNDLTTPQTYYNPELLPPENSTFLDRNFVCRLRCLLDNSSGFIGLHFQGRLKSLQGQNEKDKDGKPIPPQLALFALASPLQSPSILEIRTKNFFFRTKHKLDFTPLACDAKGQIMLGYTEEELCYRGSGYQFIHAADMLHCAENHIRMIKTGETGMTVFRLLTKLNGWMWVRANARLIYKNGRPEFIVVSQRVVTNEEGEENLRKRRLQVPFSYTTGEAVLYDSNLPNALRGPMTGDTSGSDDNNQDEVLNPDSLLGSLMKQDKSIYLSVHSQNKRSPSFQEDPSAQPEDDCGGIFSSSWQEGMLSLPDSSLFKHKSQDDLAEERDAELWSFMRNLGISREDFELFQQDETFLNVDLDGRDTLPDLTDGILCYVQESLRKRSDCAFFDSVRLGDQVPSCAPSVLQDYMHQLPKLQQAVSPNQPSIASLWQPQQAEQSRLHPQSLQFQPLAPMQQHCLHTQPNPQMVVQANQHRVHRLAQPLTPQQHQPLNGQVSTHQHCKQQQQEHSGLLFSQPATTQHMQLCQELKHKRVNVSSHDSLSQQDLINSQKIPILFHVDQSDIQRQIHPLHGRIYLDEPTQALPFKNQFNTVSVTCTQDLTYTPMQLQNQSTTGISPHCDGPRFSSLGSEAGGQHNVTGAPVWPVGNMQQQQHLLVDPQPVNMDFGLHLSTTDQPHMTQFQNSSHGNHTEPGPGPKRKGAFGHSEQTKHQPPGAN